MKNCDEPEPRPIVDRWYKVAIKECVTRYTLMPERYLLPYYEVDTFNSFSEEHRVDFFVPFAGIKECVDHSMVGPYCDVERALREDSKKQGLPELIVTSSGAVVVPFEFDEKDGEIEQNMVSEGGEEGLLKTFQEKLPDLMVPGMYKVVLDDQFQGHCEYGYTDWGVYDSLEAAIKIAKAITDQGIKQCGSVQAWYGVGDAGLVYDAKGLLVWSGVEQYMKLLEKGKADEKSGQ